MPGSDLDQRTSRRLWIFAALMALALHLGGAALALASWRNDADEALGAAGAEYAVELASPDVPEMDLPAGPDSEQSPPQEEMIEQKAEVKDADLPKDRPTDAEDPDRIVTTSDAKKPKEDDPKIAAVETQAQDYSPASEASARKKLDEGVRESDTAKAPNPGIGKDRLALTAKWGKVVSAYFQLHLRYPENKHKTTVVTVNLVLNRLGKILSVAVAESSGDPAFDDAAIAMVHRSDPVPPPPADLTEDEFSFNLPVKFNKPKD
jgi:periplasmic protein TonB